MTDTIEKMYYTVGEVAKELGKSKSSIRYKAAKLSLGKWRHGKVRRLNRKELEVLKGLKWR